MSDNGKQRNTTYLTFYLDRELYGLDIYTVREVLEYTPVTRVPRTAEHMCGVINVRGHAVPVVDLRTKFGLEKTERTVDTCIIILEIDLQGEVATMGVLVDGVQEVLDIPPENIEQTPRLGSKIDTRFIQGIGKVDEKFFILLDINEIFSLEELGSMAQGEEDRPGAGDAPGL